MLSGVKCLIMVIYSVRRLSVLCLLFVMHVCVFGRLHYPFVSSGNEVAMEFGCPVFWLFMSERTIKIAYISVA